MCSQSQSIEEYASYLISTHDALLESKFTHGTYQKLYSYTQLVNGFAALLTEEQAALLAKSPEVVLIEKDTRVRPQTTHTPSYLGLPDGAWRKAGGATSAGEGIVIGLVDTGIDPSHPSFSDKTSKPYHNATQYKGSCEIAAEFPEGSCNKKLVGARHFAAAAIASGEFNASIHFASPLDGDGHGTHTASTAAGNNNIAVKVNRLKYGFANGMAPRAHIAVYKALYPGFGGFIADVVAAIEQAVKDKVDILSLSIGVSAPPAGVATFFNIFDMAMLSAASAGVFIAHSAGNTGPFPQSILSFSPWICSVAASTHDRTYSNSVSLGNNTTIPGIGLSLGTPGTNKYALIGARDAVKKNSGATIQVDECQNASLLNKTMVQGKILICTYGIEFLFGDFTMKRVVSTAKKLSAVGVVMFITGDLDGKFTIRLAPYSIPALIIPNMKGMKAILTYYDRTPRFTATAQISGTNAKFSHKAPIVTSFSSRGPDCATSGFEVAEVLKPNIMAPGYMIWAAWSQKGVENSDFKGKRFAILSGTSMAAPHIAGIAALVKQANLKLSPAGLHSALTTTASIIDPNGKPLLAQHPSSNISLEIGPATPFDYGAGAINATAAMDPGLIYDAGFDDYISFLCSISESAAEKVKNITGRSCKEGSYSSKSLLSQRLTTNDLNLPSITIANLTSTRRLRRRVKSIGLVNETYRIKIVEPRGVMVTIKPMMFTIAPQETQELLISLSPCNQENKNAAVFGHYVLHGNANHTVLSHISIVSSAAMDSSCQPEHK